MSSWLKKKFLQEISALQHPFHHDHSYAYGWYTVEGFVIEKDVPYTQQRLMNKRYQNHIIMFEITSLCKTWSQFMSMISKHEVVTKKVNWK